MLTGQELVDQKIITGEISAENVQQHGVDLNLIKVEEMIGCGIIPNKGKTTLVDYRELEPIDDYWRLVPGQAYNITFSQGCNIPADKMLLIRHRSSLLRNGAFINSSIFDAGFKTEQIGTVMIVMHPIVIQKNARIAQIYAHNSNIVKNLYSGQYQGK